MISLFGYTLSSSAPWLLLGIPAATALLVYIFRAKGIGARYIIPTLFLLKQLPEHTPARKRFVPPLQFWIELSILCLLSLAAAGILATETGKRVAVVIDTSKSMGTLHTSGESRLSTAIRLATADIASARPTNRFTVFEASDLLTRHSAPLVSITGALSAVRSLEQSHAEDRIASLAGALESAREFDSLWIYTDKTVEERASSESLRVITAPSDTASLMNIWIRSVAIQNSSEGARLEVTVSLASTKEISSDIIATCATPDTSDTFTLTPVTTLLTSKAPTRVLLGPITSPWVYCNVRAIPNSAAISDALSLDNEAWIANNRSSNTIALRSALSPTQLGLSTLSRLPITSVGSESVNSDSNTIFHRQSPQTAPKAPSLAVFPLPGPLPWKGGKVAPQGNAAVEITRWDESHPLLQYVQPAMISIPTASALECPESSTPIIFSAKGPLVCAGEESGARFVVTGFELFPFDGLRNPTLSVFTLNIFKWLFQSGASSDGGNPLGTFAPPPDVTGIHELAPISRELDLREDHSINVTHPCVLQLIRSPNDARMLSKGTSVPLVFNSFSNAESDINRSLTFALPLPNTPNATKLRPPQSMPLQTALAALALLILTIDIFRRIVRRSRWGSL